MDSTTATTGSACAVVGSFLIGRAYQVRKVPDLEVALAAELMSSSGRRTAMYQYRGYAGSHGGFLYGAAANAPTSGARMQRRLPTRTMLEASICAPFLSCHDLGSRAMGRSSEQGRSDQCCRKTFKLTH